ncbi:hypothetical protein [Lichenibacterium dinghuense]|uniref:hypothetical protein n=1 Tax=Lichenibacterium dinghuense TaxID=2895977 RepID=UPI001F38AA98|nr:hypothetical protein [Lichenibacterium sp. 6Y81]
MTAPASRLGASMAQTLGLALCDAAFKRVVPLSDFIGGERHLRLTWLTVSLNAVADGRHIAIDLAVDAARHPDARPVRALRAAADLFERALTHAQSEDDHLTAWRRLSELLDRALAGVAP